MKRPRWHFGLVSVLSLAFLCGPVWGRGFGGGGGRVGGGGGGGFRGGGGGGFGGGMGGGGYRGGGMPSGGYRGGGMPSGGYRGNSGGLSGNGYRPTPAARPSTPSTRPSNPGSRPGGGSNIGSRPGTGTRPGGSGGTGRPSTGGGNSNLVHRPGQGSGNGLQPGSRPEIRPGGGITRPDLSPGTRPGAGGAGTAGRPSQLPGRDGVAGNLPGIGNRPGAGTRPGAGAGNRPATLPGLGGAGAIGAGAIGAGDRMAGNRGSVADRRQDLSGRFDQLQSNWGNGNFNHWEGPNGGSINHIGFWGPNGYWGHTGAWGPNGGHWGHSTGIGPNGAYATNRYFGPAGHWSRNWGGWYNGYGPAWGNGRWNYLWNQYPVAMAFGATMWGLNAVGWAFGVGSYWNPYYDTPVYYNDQPIVTYQEPIFCDPGAAATLPEETEEAPTEADELTKVFDSARAAFKLERYDDALKWTNEALSKAPHDAAINEFRSLVLFAQGKYRESAATIHAVLAAGPGWNWTTMISLYPQQETYTEQLRRLEEQAKGNPQAADLRFLLAYHYLTCDYKEAAVAMLADVVRLQPKDELASELLKMYQSQPEQEAPKSDAPPPKLDESKYPMEKLEGTWTAKADGNEFRLELGKDGAFKWSFQRDGKSQEVAGAYVVRGDNLVMQPDSGGTMLSTIDLKNDKTLAFTPIGNSKALTFTR